MNQPNEDRIKKIEDRVDKLEEDRDGIVESEKLLLKMARLHRIGLQELRASVEVDIADLRERLDTIERTMATKEDIAEIKTEHGKRFDRLETEHGKRFDRLETIMLQILDRFPLPEGE